MKKIIFAFLALVLAAFPASAEEPRVMEFDVAVIGAGCGGSAAAIQAARLGMEVAVVEESDWVGGQMTGGGVSTMDDVRRTRTGVYGEFLRRASAYYEARETPVNTCYWGSDTFAFEPWVIQHTLLDMMREAGEISLFMETRVLEAKMKDGAVRAAVVERGGERIELRAKVFIDATEAGDFIPLTGARYRAGHGDSSGELDGVIQDITYVAVIRRYPEGVPEELRFTRRPPGYEEYAPRFREIIALGGDSWPGEAPFNPNVFKAYRGMPDISNPASMLIDGGRAETWPLITRSAVNWANDYPHGKDGLDGMPVKVECRACGSVHKYVAPEAHARPKVEKTVRVKAGHNRAEAVDATVKAEKRAAAPRLTREEKQLAHRAEENEQAMLEEIGNVKTGQITYAVRDTHIDGREIHQGDIMGIGDQGILSVGQSVEDTVKDMLSQLVDDDSELISLYYGQDIQAEDAEKFAQTIEELYPDVDIDVHMGGQPIYYYVLSVE